jgi:peroxiredoxin Q/BCP
MRVLAVGLGLVGVAALAVLAACATAGSKTKRAAGRLKEGDRAPDVGALNQDGVAVRLSQFHGRMVVLYFYPKDRTSGCTVEAHGFSAEYEKIRASGAEVVGVSNDDAKSHRNFCDKESLPFPLLADTDKTIADAFGVGSIFGFYQRITFLIDGDGVIRKVFDPVKPGRHAAEVMAAIADLSGGAHQAHQD